MPKFIVTMREVWTQGMAVQASSKEEAIRLVKQGQGAVIEGLFEYSHSMDSDTWTAELSYEYIDKRDPTASDR